MELEPDLRIRQVQDMAHRDQLRCALRAHDTGDLGYRQNITLLDLFSENRREDLLRHLDLPRRDRHPARDFFSGHVHHVGIALRIEVRKFLLLFHIFHSPVLFFHFFRDAVLHVAASHRGPRICLRSVVRLIHTSQLQHDLLQKQHIPFM